MSLARGLTESEWAAEERLASIESDLKEIKETLDFIKATIVQADSTITKVAADVMPTLNQVMTSPMLRMLTGGKK